MRYIKTTPNEILLKYDNELSLVQKYIGPDREHGDGYFDETQYAWFECLIGLDEPPSLKHEYNHGAPVAIICFTENKFLPNSLHLSVLEVFNKYQNKGIGSIIMVEVDRIAKDFQKQAITLQTRTPQHVKFYKQFGYVRRTIDKCPIMRKYI